MATNGWIGEQTVHSWGSYNSRLTTNVYINGIRRYSDHIDVSGVIYLFCKSSGAKTVWYDWAITAWCGGGSLGQIKPRTYNNNILGKSWSKNFSIRINCSNSATSATFQVGFSDSNMGGKDKYWTLYFDRYATSPSGITSTATYTQYSTISTSCSGINWGQGYSNRSLTCTASYTYNGKTENFTLGTWTDGATSKSVTKSDFNFPADLNVTVKWTASTNIGSTSSTTQVRAKQTFPAPNLSNTIFTAESTAPYCIRVNVSGVDFGDNYSEQKLELYGTYELDGIIYDNKLGEVSNQTSWTLEYDASQEAEPWTKIPDDSSILLRLVADNGNRTSDKTIIINCQSSYEAYVIEHISEEEKEKSETYTGKNIQIQNAPKDAPLADFKLDGNTSQQTYTGKNLFQLNGSTSEKGLTISRDVSTGSLTFGGTTTGTWPWLNNSDVSLPAGTYTFSIDHALPYNLTLRLYETSSSYPKSVSIPAGSTSGTSTTTYPIVYLAMLYGVTSTGVQVPTTTIYPMLESGSTATSFEPYVGGIASPNPDYPQAVQTVTGENVVKISDGQGNEQSYPISLGSIELCKIGDYQDSIYKSGGKWYVRKETGKRTYTADDITIAASDTYSNVRYAQFPKGADNKQNGNYTYGGIINFFTHGKNMGATPAGGWNSYISDGLIYNSAMQDNYWCSFSKSTTLATMKEKLNGMVAYYALATPTDTEITNEALVGQLEALAAATMYNPQTNINTLYAEGNEQGALEIQYYTKWQNTSQAILLANGRNGTGNFKQVRRIGTK